MVTIPYFEIHTRDGTLIECTHCGSNAFYIRAHCTQGGREYTEAHCDHCSYASGYTAAGTTVQEALMSPWEQRVELVLGE